MKLVVVEGSLSDDKLEQAIQAVQEQAGGVRAMDGCVSYATYDDGAKLAIVQRWQTAGHFDAYRQSDLFARLGTILKPLMTSPPVTTTALVDHR